MYTIQILLVLFFIFALAKVVGRYLTHELSFRTVGGWILFWLGAILIVVEPNSTAYVAELVGIGRGADLVVYCSVALIFFAIFRLMIKIDRLEREITSLTRIAALREVEKEFKKEH